GPHPPAPGQDHPRRARPREVGDSPNQPEAPARDGPRWRFRLIVGRAAQQFFRFVEKRLKLDGAASRTSMAARCPGAAFPLPYPLLAGVVMAAPFEPVPALEAQFWQLYRDFFDRAERKRRWSIADDIPWDQCNPHLDPAVAHVVESFCAVELYLPDYTSKIL